jgi:hypothetical protein
LQLMIAELISSFRHSLLVDLIGGGNANWRLSQFVDLSLDYHLRLLQFIWIFL